MHTWPRSRVEPTLRSLQRFEPRRSPGAAAVETHDAIDDTWVAVFTVDEHGDGTSVHREVWWFDEQSRTWGLDVHETWELAPATVAALASRLRACRSR